MGQLSGWQFCWRQLSGGNYLRGEQLSGVIILGEIVGGVIIQGQLSRGNYPGAIILEPHMICLYNYDINYKKTFCNDKV